MENNNPTNFHTLYISREDLVKAVNAFPESATIAIGVEDGKYGFGTVILWVSNSGTGEKREVVIINSHTEGE